MTFWERVEQLLDDKGLNKKELADIAEIDQSTISKGIKNESSPNAEKAVKIAKYLGTTVEFLVTGLYSEKPDINALLKYSKTVQQLNELPAESRSSIELMISDMCNNYHTSKHN